MTLDDVLKLSGGGVVLACGYLANLLRMRDAEIRELNKARLEDAQRFGQDRARMALTPRRAEDPPPASLPPPGWEDEKTDHKKVRTAAEQAVIDEYLREFVERTPTGRKPQPSRPR